MRPRLAALLEIPDLISLANAALGLAAVLAVASGLPDTAARLVLLAVVADGLDGFVARRTTSSDLGVELDSLADVVSFGVAPVAIMHAAARPAGPLIASIPAVFLLAALVRLAAYNVDDADTHGFTGAPSTLAGAVVAAFYLADIPSWIDTDPALFFVALSLALAYLMLIDIRYPQLTSRDALAMGAVIVGAVLVPGLFNSALLYFVLIGLLGFLVFAPKAYWN